MLLPSGLFSGSSRYKVSIVGISNIYGYVTSPGMVILIPKLSDSTQAGTTSSNSILPAGKEVEYSI